MKKKLFVLLFIIVLLTGCSSSLTVTLPYDTSTYHNQNKFSSSDVPNISLFAKNLCVFPINQSLEKDSYLTADALMLANLTDKKILYADNIYQSVYPASITKIVTAFVALKHSKLSDIVTISYDASHITEAGASVCGFHEGDKISLEALLYAFLLQSGNDAGVAIAEHVAGNVDLFVEWMNEEVKKLGCVGTHFVNPHGLHDDNHYTTAYDMYLVFHELLSNKKYKETFLSIIKEKSYTVNYENQSGEKIEKTFINTNPYLTGAGKAPENITVIGGKTGTTSKAGSCLILYDKDKKGKEYISFIFHANNASDLILQMNHLLEKIDGK